MKRKLYRTKDNRMVAGVLAGIAEHFDHDPTIWRLMFILLLIVTGFMPGILLYIVAIYIIPLKPDAYSEAEYTVYE